MHLTAVTLKEKIMYRKIFAIVAVVILSAASSTAQEFERHNRWMVGGNILTSNSCNVGLGATAVYGREFSELVFLGVGFGGDARLFKGGESTTTITEPDGTTEVHINPPYKYSFFFPLYADLQVDFSRGKAPVFAEFKAGVCVGFDLVRHRGTCSYNNVDLRSGGPLLGFGIGKRFALKNSDELNIVLGVDSIWGPFYAELPVSLGVRYGF